MRIDLHADDFGATPHVNFNIVSVWNGGALDSASVIANGNGILEAAKIVNSNNSRQIRLAVHLNLSEGKPMLEPSCVNLLVDTGGHFKYGFLGIWKLWLAADRRLRANILAQIETEWREQIRYVKKIFAPMSISAIDGHIHIHMLPFLFPLAARLAVENSCSEIRISREFFHFSFKESLRTGYPANILKFALLNRLARPAINIVRKHKLKSPDAVCGILYSGHMTRETAMSAVQKARRACLNWIEVIFHPGRANRDEKKRWAGNPAIAKFYMSAERDMERDELLKIGHGRF